MKRIAVCILLVALLCGCAQASWEYNSFFHDEANAGRFDSIAVAGEYVYWLHAPDDSLSWLEVPYNLYRMKPGQGEPELLLESGKEPFIISDMVCIGDKLLLSVIDEDYGKDHPATVNLDGSGYKRLPGNIGSVVVMPGRIYNSVDGGIYEIDTNTMKPDRIYSYPEEIARDNPVLFQCEGLNLYFSTDSHDWYRLDLQDLQLTKIASIRGDGFALDYKFYVSDYDAGVTYRYDMRGERTKISDHAYIFQGGSGDYVKAGLQDPDGFGSAPGGRIFDMTWLWDDLDQALVGTCNLFYDYLLDGKLYCYDWKNNRVDFCTDPVAAVLE